jgi:hypothetical protein
MYAEGIVSVLAIIAPLGVLWFMLWALGKIGDLKKTNQKLNDKLTELTDRDERGRFRGGKDRK